MERRNQPRLTNQKRESAGKPAGSPLLSPPQNGGSGGPERASTAARGGRWRGRRRNGAKAPPGWGGVPRRDGEVEADERAAGRRVGDD